MLSSEQVKALEAIHDEAYVVIRASENWAETYRQAPEQFRALIRMENRLFRNLKAYFRELAQKRVAQLVNWNEYQNRMVKATDITVTVDDSNAKAEETLLLGVMFDEIKDGMFQGAMAGREVYTRWIGTAEVNDMISQAAITHAEDLAKGLTETTLKEVQKSIQLSIDSGEDLRHTVARLQTIIKDPKRAELIARTESVRAYNAGIMEYGKRTGAATKTWIALPGADEGSALQPCVDNADQDPIGIDEDFVSGDPYPPAHPRCRCQVLLQYDQVDDRSLTTS